MSAPCIICGNTQNNSSFEVQEHQMGIGHSFHYQQCGACHSAQLYCHVQLSTKTILDDSQ